MFRSADAYIRELSGNPSDVRADVGIRAPILSLSQQPLTKHILARRGLCHWRSEECSLCWRDG